MGTLRHSWGEYKAMQPLWKTLWQILKKLTESNHMTQHFCSSVDPQEKGKHMFTHKHVRECSQ